MTGGIVTGGWAYVWAAYGITGVALLGYGLGLALRLKGKRKDQEEETR